MSGVNKVILIGNAGRDAELRYTASGSAMATVSLAVNSRRRNQSGDYEDQTEWFNVTLFGNTAEKLSQYITKGKQLFVEGRLQTRSWEDDQGQKHYRSEVIANTVQLLGGGGDGGAQRGGRGNTGGGWGDPDDLPFD